MKKNFVAFRLCLTFAAVCTARSAGRGDPAAGAAGLPPAPAPGSESP